MSDIRKDPRFSKALYDPQYQRQRPPSKTKKIDARFAKPTFKEDEPARSEQSESSDFSDSDVEDYEGVVSTPQVDLPEEVQAQNIQLGMLLCNRSEGH